MSLITRQTGSSAVNVSEYACKRTSIPLRWIVPPTKRNRNGLLVFSGSVWLRGGTALDRHRAVRHAPAPQVRLRRCSVYAQTCCRPKFHRPTSTSEEPSAAGRSPNSQGCMITQCPLGGGTNDGGHSCRTCAAIGPLAPVERPSSTSSPENRGTAARPAFGGIKVNSWPRVIKRRHASRLTWAIECRSRKGPSHTTLSLSCVRVD